MAKFRFRFDPVLRQRSAAEDNCQRRLAQVLRQRMILRNQLKSMQQTIIDSKRSLADGLIGKVDMGRIAHFARYSGQESQRAQQIVLHMVQLERQIDEARNQLVQATRARRTMQMLRQRHHDRWRRDQEQRQAAEMDELATQQYLRRMNVEMAT